MILCQLDCFERAPDFHELAANLKLPAWQWQFLQLCGGSASLTDIAEFMLLPVPLLERLGEDLAGRGLISVVAVTRKQFLDDTTGLEFPATPEPEATVAQPAAGIASDPEPASALASEREPEFGVAREPEPVPEVAAASEPEPEFIAASAPEPQQAAALAPVAEPVIAAVPDAKARAAVAHAEASHILANTSDPMQLRLAKLKLRALGALAGVLPTIAPAPGNAPLPEAAAKDAEPAAAVIEQPATVYDMPSEVEPIVYNLGSPPEPEVLSHDAIEFSLGPVAADGSEVHH